MAAAENALTRAWTASEPLPDPKHEAFAQAFASTGSIRGAERIAGVSHAAAMQWGSGHTRLAKRVQERARWIKATACQVLPSAEQLYVDWLEATKRAVEEGAHKAALDSYAKLYAARKEAEREGYVVTAGSPPSSGRGLADVHALLRGEPAAPEESALCDAVSADSDTATG